MLEPATHCTEKGEVYTASPAPSMQNQKNNEYSSKTKAFAEKKMKF